MKPTKPLASMMLTLAITSVMGITTSLAQAAATLPNILPDASETGIIKAETKSGTTLTGNGIQKITSLKSKGELEVQTLKLGRFKVSFEESSAATGKCTGLNDTQTGLILVEGSFHIRDYKEGSNLRTAAALLFIPVHFTCPGGILFIFSGCVAGRITPENVLTKFLTITLSKEGAGTDNTIITLLNEEDTANEACQLLASENGGAFKLGALETTQSIEKGVQNGEEVTVLVMPL